MKKLILTLLAAFCALNISSIQAQEMKIELDVNGLKIDNQYSNEQFKAALGEPTRIYTWGDKFESGFEYHYMEGDSINRFKCQQGIGFCEFSITSSKFVLFGGRLRVGDNITKIAQLGIGTPFREKDNVYYLGYKNEVMLNIYTDNNGKIIKFYYYAAV